MAEVDDDKDDKIDEEDVDDSLLLTRQHVCIQHLPGDPGPVCCFLCSFIDDGVLGLVWIR